MFKPLFFRWSLLAMVVGGLFFSGRPLWAQELELAGRVLGPDGEPVAEQDVLLHRVTQAGGALLARSTTDSTGRFTVSTSANGGPEAVYFVAMRYDGKLYIGPMRKAPFAPGDEYIVQVGIPGVGDISALSAGASTPSASAPLENTRSAQPGAARGAAFGVALLLTAFAIGAYLSMRGPVPSQRRRALIRIAELDERSGGKLTPEQARRRNELLRRATEPSR